MADPIPLPHFLEPLFWDIAFGDAVLARHGTFIAERVLEYGDDRAIAWLLRELGPVRIADVLRSSRRLSRNTGRYWALLLDIREEEIPCLSRPSPPLPLPSSAG